LGTDQPEKRRTFVSSLRAIRDANATQVVKASG
jgi:hypothetical protein